MIALALAIAITISGDTGGFLRWYLPAVRYYLALGFEFRVTGLCASGCTLVLSAPRDQLCVTKGAVFQFHRGNSDLGGAILWHAYPPALQKRLGKLTDQIQTIRWPETARYARVC